MNYPFNLEINKIILKGSNVKLDLTEKDIKKEKYLKFRYYLYCFSCLIYYISFMLYFQFI